MVSDSEDADRRSRLLATALARWEWEGETAGRERGTVIPLREWLRDPQPARSKEPRAMRPRASDARRAFGSRPIL